MNAPLIRTLALAVVAALGMAQLAQAAGLFADSNVDPRFRAKIMKEKAKQNVLLGDSFNFQDPGNAPDGTQCGSQNIGNVDSRGRPGAAPREVFVFAPNAINLVSGRGCR